MIAHVSEAVRYRDYGAGGVPVQFGTAVDPDTTGVLVRRDNQTSRQRFAD